eukprot:COSAG02_NODE_4265_length_5572_cov_3.251416_3_plen_46_part_00
MVSCVDLEQRLDLCSAPENHVLICIILSGVVLLVACGSELKSTDM